MGGGEWLVCREDAEAVRALRESGCPRVLSVLLANRGCRTAEEAGAFLSPGRDVLHGPLEMKGMAQAAARVRLALERGEHIAVYGDYDVDGVTACALLSSFLQSRGGRVTSLLPEREGEGYGLNAGAVERCAREGVTLLITVDTGISAFGEAELARKLKMDLIVTDHHEPRSSLPEAFAVVDPKQPGCGYPFKGLSGVGVAFKLACALEEASQEELLEQYGDFVCLGTVADVVPLLDENRLLVLRGLEAVRARRHKGVAALCDEAGLSGRPVTSSAVAYTLAPRINAAGRMASAREALELLLCGEEERAGELARALCGYNLKRQQTEEAILSQALRQLEDDPDAARRPVLMLAGSGWYNGVIGIVAARLMERFDRPCILTSFENGVGRGSCRSLPGFDIFKALTACAGSLVKYGGHTLAAGFTVSEEEYGRLCEGILHYAASLGPLPGAKLTLECALAPGEVTLATAREIRRLEPFGCGNPEPLFLLAQAAVAEVKPLSEGRHLKTRLCLPDGGQAEGMLFSAGRFEALPRPGEVLDLAVNLTVNSYRGSERLTVCLRALRPTRAFRGQERLYRRFLDSPAEDLPGGDELGLYDPEREEFAAVWRYLKAAEGSVIRPADALWALRRKAPGIGLFKLLLITDVFEETGLIKTERRDGALRVAIRKTEKVDLGGSALLRKLRRENAHGRAV